MRVETSPIDDRFAIGARRCLAADCEFVGADESGIASFPQETVDCAQGAIEKEFREDSAYVFVPVARTPH